MNNQSMRHIAVASFVIVGQSALAGITTVSGSTHLILNPNNMKYIADAYQLNPVQYWTETENVALATNTVVSILPPVSFPTNSTSHFNNELNTIAAGTRVNSYFVYYDPQSGSTRVRFQTDNPILGLVTNSRVSGVTDHFMLSDFLINPAVPVANRSPVHFDARGLEVSTSEFITWYAPNDIELNLNAATPGDQLRIITAVPEPTSVLGLVAGFGLLLRKRNPKVY